LLPESRLIVLLFLVGFMLFDAQPFAPDEKMHREKNYGLMLF
jgi:hypothetical protein